MKNAIRCCIACILPCGALDVIRIVHANGRVEVLCGAVKAEEIMKLHPKHVLKKPSSSEHGVRPKIAVVPPDADLKRGKIYFLMPLPPQPQPPPPKKTRQILSSAKRKMKGMSSSSSESNKNDSLSSEEEESLISDQYLSEILSERVTSQRSRRRGRAGVWRPHLDSISETPVDA